MNSGTETTKHGAPTWRVDGPMVVVAPRRSVERIPIDGITIRNEWYASVKHWISFPVALLLLIVLAPVFAVGALAGPEPSRPGIRGSEQTRFPVVSLGCLACRDWVARPRADFVARPGQ